MIFSQTMFLLFILHHIVNPAWLKTLFKGRYTLLRIYLTGVGVLLLIVMVLQPVSGILMSIHVGNHAGVHPTGKKKSAAGLLLRTIAIAVSIYGVYAFVSRGMVSYLFLKDQFVFFDLSASRLRFLADYASMMCLFACIGTGFCKGLKRLTPTAQEAAKDRSD